MALNDLSNKQLKVKVEQVYSNTLNDFKKIAEEIENALEKKMHEILKENNSYQLKHNIGITGGYYFKVSSRVKNVKSLSDKLVRKSDLLELKNKNGTGNDSSSIKQYLYERYGDLIGVKILGDLNQDEINIHKLLKENKEKFKSDDYEITFKNIDKQPEPMQNGLEIYKIDCEYKNTVFHEGPIHKFELQIKSQLMSAWADMEHQHYYKNHLFNPVRFTNQPLMNEVGKLLKQTESILIKIRSSEDDYKKIEKELLFTSEICEIFSEYLEGVLEVNPEPMLTNAAQTLYRLSQVIPIDKNVVKQLINSGFNKDCTCVNPNYINYRKLVEHDFSLQIIENIVGVWYESNEGVDRECFTEKLHEDLTAAIIKFTQLEDASSEFSEIIKDIFKRLNNNKVYLNLSKFNNISNLFKYLKDESNNTSVIETNELDELIGKSEEELEVETDSIDSEWKELCVVYAEILYSDLKSINIQKISRKYNLGKNKQKLIEIINRFYEAYCPGLNNQLEKFLEVIKGNDEV